MHTWCWPLPRHHMVGRDVLGAPRQRGHHGDAHRHAGRRDVGPYHAHMVLAPATAPHGRARRPRRAAQTGTPTGTPSCTRAAGTSAPTTHTWYWPLPRHHMVGRDVLGAPHQRGRHGDAHRHAGRRDVGPYHAYMVLASATAPHGRARRPRRAAPTGTSRGRPQARGPPGTSAPTTHTWCWPLPRWRATSRARASRRSTAARRARSMRPRP